MELKTIRVSLIDPDPNQARKHFDPQELEELAASIEKDGLLSPILLRKANDRFVLIAGERRLRSIKLLGRETIAAFLYEGEDAQRIALIENLQRKDLTPLEEAEALQQLMRQEGYTQQELATLLSKSRPYIANSLRLLGLDDSTKDALNDQSITQAHGRILAGLKHNDRKDLLARILEEDLTVRETERRAKHIKKKHEADPYLREALDELEDKWNIRASDAGTGKQNKLVFEFYDEDTLQRFVERLIDS